MKNMMIEENFCHHTKDQENKGENNMEHVFFTSEPMILIILIVCIFLTQQI